MPQVFHHSTNLISRLTIYGFFLLLIVLGFVPYLIDRSPYVTEANVPKVQPVPFSHKHHTAELGIDCRYCHTSVEQSSFAGLPSTETCMTCHSQIWKDAPVLEPVRASFQTGRPIQWTRVYDLPDYVYFDHSIHVNKGISCASCHGRVDEMPITWKTQPLYMRWCLDCHRHPEENLRRPQEVFDMQYQAPENQSTLGRRLAIENHVHQQGLTD